MKTYYQLLRTVKFGTGGPEITEHIKGDTVNLYSIQSIETNGSHIHPHTQTWTISYLAKSTSFANMNDWNDQDLTWYNN